MNINFSNGKYSKWILNADAPYRQAFRHGEFALSGKKLGLSTKQKIGHVVFAIVKCIPIVGHLTAAIDKCISVKSIRLIHLAPTNPYQKGFEHGKLLASEINKIYPPILNFINSLNNNEEFNRNLTGFKENLNLSDNKNLKSELRGLVAGLEEKKYFYSYEDILKIHVFLDAAPGHFGCSIMAKDEAQNKIAAANHSVANAELFKNVTSEMCADWKVTTKKLFTVYKLSLEAKSLEKKGKEEMKNAKIAEFERELNIWKGLQNDFKGVYGDEYFNLFSENLHLKLEDSTKRRNALLNARSKKPFKILKQSGLKETIQSICFDPATGSIEIAAGGSYAHRKTTKKFKAEKIFGNDLPGSFALQQGINNHGVKVFRNLDWPWFFLGQSTVLMTSKSENADGEIIKTCKVTFPGYIGVLSGMNNKGLTVGVCSHGKDANTKGVPNPLYFSQMLETCASVQDACRRLANYPMGSSINAVIADASEAISLEISGKEDLQKREIVASLNYKQQMGVDESRVNLTN